MQNIEGIRKKKKKTSKDTAMCLSILEETIKKELKEIEDAKEREEKEDKRIRDDVCKVLKFFIDNWDKYDETDLKIVINTAKRDKVLKDFVLKWDSMDKLDNDDALKKITKLKEWLDSRFDIYDFCHFPKALLDLKEEYLKLKRPDFREWTLKKFIECYKEFLCMEVRKVFLYESQDFPKYVKDKIKATGLGKYSPFIEERMFSNFIDIAIDEDILEDNLPEILEDDDTPNYLRPKCILRKKY